MFLPGDLELYFIKTKSLNYYYPDCFLKIITWDALSSSINSNPVYIYTGTAGTGEYDWLVENPIADDYVFVSSDAPVYVHTLVTQLPYNTCKDWPVEEWEYYKENYGDKYFGFSGSDHNQRRYSIPLDDIPDGSCYCVIAHFADNHVEKSHVFQK